MVDFNCACVISRGRGWKVRRLLQPTKVTIAIEGNEGSNIRPSTNLRNKGSSGPNVLTLVPQLLLSSSF